MRLEPYTLEEIKNTYGISDSEWLEVCSLVPGTEEAIFNLHPYQAHNLMGVVATVFEGRNPLGWAAIGLAFPGFHLYVEQSLRNVGGGATRRLYERLDSVFQMSWDDTYLTLCEIRRIHNGSTSVPSIIDMKRLLTPYLVPVQEHGTKAIPFLIYFHNGLGREATLALDNNLNVELFDSAFAATTE